MNVNLDVLELIFAILDGSDLVAAALVSRAFLAGAIPALYARIEYSSRHAKRAQHLMSPFATLAAHDHLAVHVRRVAIHAAPVFPSASNHICPSFLKDLAHALRTASNIRSFVCTVKLLPPLLPHLVDKPHLSHMRICASLGSRQMSVLQTSTGLHSLSLDFPSWNVIDALPAWSMSMQKTLAHLTLFMSQDIDALVLNTVLAHLPRLRGFHVIACPRITHGTVLRALSHTPSLQELSLSIFPSQDNTLPHLDFAIPPLTHLSIDVRASYPGLKSLIAGMISRLSPRDALAICGGWIGEIRSSAELADASQGGNPPGNASPGGLGNQNAPGHHHPYGPPHGHDHHGNDQANDPPLLSPPSFYHGVAYPNQNGQANPVFFGFSIPFPPNDPDDDNNGNGDNNPGPAPPNPDPNVNLDLPSLVASFPPTLSALHIPQISPAGLRELVERCESLQVLGFALGITFASPASDKANRMTSRTNSHITKSGARPEVCVLASILSHARSLRELIIDTSDMDASGNASMAGGDRTGESHVASFCGAALLTPATVRTLMRESSQLRRIVGEGRVWESTTPTPSLPVPFSDCLSIELSLSKVRHGPGNNHAHGTSSFGSHGNGYGQVEVGNEHWFWLTGSRSGCEVQHGL